VPRGDDVTVLLARWRNGESGADSELMESVQHELRRVAAAYLRRERPGHTLEPTALINETYLRLVGQRRVSWQNRAHFYGIAAQIMRRILVDHARKRLARKRVGLSGEQVSLSGVVDPHGPPDIDVLSLHEALTELAALDARQAGFVTLRYFGGLTVDEVATEQRVSATTVKRELITAMIWLRHRLATHAQQDHQLE
jgi:RNA polymerase sigma-70 factor (ECF subfamily)